MRIFELDHSINFIDDNDIVIGYDYTQSCCEEFGYVISETCLDDNTDLEDPSDEVLSCYFIDTTAAVNTFVNEKVDRDGGIVSFKLIAEGKPDLWLTLFNYHNGYYSHGFTLKDHKNDKLIAEGCL